MDNVSGASTPFVLNGVEYWLSPLTDKDMVELDEFLQFHVINLARKTLAPNATEAEKERAETIALKMAVGLSWMSGEGAKIIGTKEGMTRLVWFSLRKRNPELKLETVREHIFNPAAISSFNTSFRRVNNMPDVSEKKVQRKPKRSR